MEQEKLNEVVESHELWLIYVEPDEEEEEEEEADGRANLTKANLDGANLKGAILDGVS